MVSSKLAKLSIVVPAYNEERFIVETIRSVLKADSMGLRKEVIVVNDGSKDDTVRNVLVYLKKSGKSRKKQLPEGEMYSFVVGKNSVILIDKKVNAGKGAAVKTGFLHSSGDVVLVQDADLEYDPKDYPRLLEPFMNGDADVVFGSRFMSDRPHRVLYFWHYVGNTVLTMVSNMCTDLNLTDMETGYKVFKGDLIRKLAPGLQSASFGFEPEITAKVAKDKANRIYEVGIAYKGRTYGEGKKLLWWKDGVIALYRIIQFNFFS